MIFEAIKNGASGYLLKDEKPSTIIDHIHQLTEIGGAPMSPSIARKALSLLSKAQIVETDDVKPDISRRLSERERDVLKLVVEGKDYRAIAEKLFLSTHTIRKHIANIYEKLYVNSKAQVINMALQSKWFDS
jgi:DNA-binding NarL/FixJ family response regulator